MQRAHAPCSEGTPCQRCISKGLECVPAPTKRRGKKARSQQPRDSPSPAVAQQEHLISPLAFPRSDSFGGVLPDPQHLLPVKNSAWGTTIFKNEYDHQLALEVQRMTASVLASSGSSPPALPPHSSFVPLEQQSLPHGPSSSSSSTLSPSDDSSSAHNSCAHSHSELEHCSDCDPGAEAGIVMSDVEEYEDGETQSPLAARNKPSRTHPQKTAPVSKKLRGIPIPEAFVSLLKVASLLRWWVPHFDSMFMYTISNVYYSILFHRDASARVYLSALSH